MSWLVMLELLTRNSQFEVECLLSSSYIASVQTTNHLHNPLLSPDGFLPLCCPTPSFQAIFLPGFSNSAHPKYPLSAYFMFLWSGGTWHLGRPFPNQPQNARRLKRRRRLLVFLTKSLSLKKNILWPSQSHSVWRKPILWPSQSHSVCLFAFLT